MSRRRLPPYEVSLAGTLLAAREAVMAPIRPYLREAGVTDQQWRILRVLADEGALDPSSLAEKALLHPPSVSRILKELAQRGLLRRDAVKEDGRRSLLRLTAKGESLVEATAVHTLRLLDTYAKKFGPERLASLRAELAAFASAIAIDGDEVPSLEEAATRTRSGGARRF